MNNNTSISYGVKKHLPILIIIAVSLIVHFAFFGHPDKTVFDEVHFGKFISGYNTHEYFFDIHPPLGKLLISVMGYIGGFKPGFSFAEIGQKFPDNTYLWLRFLPTLAGALLPIVIFFLALRLGFSRLGALAAGLLVSFESANIVQSRLILLDSFLLLFGFSALLFYYKYKQESNRLFLWLAGGLGALSLSVKWTGATFLALIFLAEIYDAYKKRAETKFWQRFLRAVLALGIAPLAIYFSIFTIHLQLLNKTGTGDAFMTPAFQATLAGNPNASNSSVKPAGIFSKFKELNFQMYHSNATLTATHPYSSSWYTWPFMTRPIYYWFESGADGLASRIYLIGNPVIWWLSTAALLYAFITAAGNIFLRFRKEELVANAPLILLGGYFLNLLPFIGIKRAMFLYHYLTALIIAILVLVFFLDKLKHKKLVIAAILAAAAIAFIFFSPLVYGLPISEPSYNLRAWFPSWK